MYIHMFVAIQSFPLISLAIQKFAMIANFYNTPSNFYNNPSNFYNSPSSPFAKGKTRWPVFSVVSALRCKVYSVKCKVYNFLFIGFTLLAGFLVLQIHRFSLQYSNVLFCNSVCGFCAAWQVIIMYQ